jgi:beta-lactamase regulating signal transducer with metallopeptidase domain
MTFWIMQNALVVTVLALVVWGISHWRRLGPAARHALWLLVLIKLLMPPVVSWPWAIVDPFARTQAGGGVSVTQVDTEAPPATTALELASDRGGTPNMAAAVLGASWTGQRVVTVLTVAWLAGVAAYLLLQGLRLLRLARRTAGAKPAPALAEEVARLSRQMRMRPIEVREAERLASPLVWSFVGPVLLWPAGMSCDTPASRAMLAHELAHVRRRDHWVGWLKLGAGCLWWWHPVYWFVCWKLSEEAELACDAWAVQNVTQARRAYAEALLAVCETTLEPTPALAVGIMEGGRRIMERRLRMIMGGAVPLRLSRAGLAALGAAALALAPAWAQNGPTPQNGGGRGVTGRAPAIPEMAVRSSAAPEPAMVSPTARIEDPANWVPKVNGCLIEQTGSRIHIAGVNNIDGWGHGNGISYAKALPEGDFYACVDFMVPVFQDKDSTTPGSDPFSGSGGRGNGTGARVNALVYLRAHSSTGRMLAILYQPNGGTYQVQGWGSPNTFSQPPLPKIGDEDRVFHRLKLKYSAASKTAAGWVDDQFIGSLDYSMSGTVTFELLANTDKQGVQIDLLFNNLSITPDIADAPPTPARVQRPVPIRGGTPK